MFFHGEVPFRLDQLRSLLLIVVPVVSAITFETIRRPSRAVRLLVLLTVVPPAAYGLRWGGRLWVQHLVVLVPLVYALAVVTYDQWLRLSRFRQVVKGFAVSLALVLAVLDSQYFRVVVDQLESTGGTGYFSDAADAFLRQARGDPALYVLPDWGLWTQFVMITRGATQFEQVFDVDSIERTLCSGRDVVVASNDPGARARTEA